MQPATLPKNTLVGLNTIEKDKGEKPCMQFNLLQDESSVVVDSMSLPTEECLELKQSTLMSSINILNSQKSSLSDDGSDDGVRSDKSEPFQNSGSEYVPSNHSEQNESEEESEEVVLANVRNDELETPRGRKRTRSKGKLAKNNALNSERNKNKHKRMKGENYVAFKFVKKEKTYKQVQRGERKMGPACKCKLSTTSRQFFCQAFTEPERKAIFDNFWKNLTWGEKKVYIGGLVDTATPKCHRTDIQGKQRQVAYKFYLKKGNDVRKRVCKKMFMETLCIREWSIKSWVSQNITDENIPPSNKQSTIPKPAENLRRNKQPSKDKEYLIRFLRTLPQMESHYCRKDTTKLYLESQWQNLNELYRFYCAECSSQNFQAINHTTFREEFKNLNLSLYRPKKDQCDTCTGYSVGTIKEEQYSLHINRKKMARAEKESQKNQATNDPSRLLFSMDVQSVLTAPKLQVSASYYKMKLTVHNFTFFNMVSGKGDCYIWHEAAGGVTSNEFTSIVIDYIKRYTTKETKSVIIFSDGCGYQNRNVTLSNAISALAKTKDFEIYQHYLEKGYTQMECDSIHACIEKKLKNREIYVPGCYVQIAKTAKIKNKYEVHYLSHTFFKKYSVLNSYISIRPGNRTHDPKVTDLRCLAYRVDGTIEFKITYEDAWTPLTRRKQKNEDIDIMMVSSLYSAPLKIKPDKFQHLQELKQFIPEDYRSFYDSLISQEK
ncbi:uncharacterized protein LOC115881209 isoform X2 [Sitophilus oryzae]|nr:uncharacterized protein LOC115881209 isoform X2 [Sitophilus oryzae]